MNRIIRAIMILGWSAAACFAAPNKDDAPPGSPFISTIFPAGGPRGQTLEVVVSGTNLLSGTGTEMTGNARLTGEGLTVRLLPGSDAKSVHLSVGIAPGAELGEHDLRIMSQNGVSNRARFLVGQLPEITETEPNSDFAHAQRLPALPVLVNGRIDQNDRDYFRFAAKAGQTLVCEVQARAIVPYIADAVPGWFDPILTLYDGNGKALQTVDDFRFNPDPVLFFTVPKDGEYVLALWDVLYRGRSDFVYRLSLGALPYLTHVFPLGGQRNTTVHVEMHGVNLPESAHDYPFSADPNPRRFLSVTSNGWRSNPLFLAAGDLPEILETEPNDSRQQAQRVTPPVTINGRIQKSGDVDWFLFSAKTGDKLTMEVLARRLGSPLDSVLTLYNAKGDELMENDDTQDPAEPLLVHHADSFLSYTIPSTGDYYLRIRDAEQKGGDEYAYRLTIAPPQPDFTLRATPDNPGAGQGDCAMLTVEALRTGGFNGEIPLTIQGLPAGCEVRGAVIQANQGETSFTITIPPGAPIAVSPLVITGSAAVDNKPVVRWASAAEAVMQAFATTHNVSTKELLLSVTESSPLSISTSAAPGQIMELRQGAEIQITVKAVRKNGVKGGISITAQRPPMPGTSQKPGPGGINARAPYIPQDKDETVLTLSAPRQAPIGLRNIIVIGTMKVGKANITSIAPAIPVKIIPADTPPSPPVSKPIPPQ